MEKLNLADIELYYSSLVDDESRLITIEGKERNHILNVMRHRLNDEIYLTNGLGKIFKCRIAETGKEKISSKILSEYTFPKRFSNITFCIPKLRNIDRFEFALEKCTELGITNFIVYQAKRSVAKGFNQRRIEKILISAMKQSLLSWIPRIQYLNTTNDIADIMGDKIIFDQSSRAFFNPNQIKSGNNYLFIFGPEGGFAPEELESLKTSENFKLVDNRLRTETAIIKIASLL